MKRLTKGNETLLISPLINYIGSSISLKDSSLPLSAASISHPVNCKVSPLQEL